MNSNKRNQTISSRDTAAMTPAVAQMRVTRELHEAEAALDEALIRQANLLSSMVTARRDVGLAPFLGQDALMRLVKSQQAMVDAGGELARVHGRLSAIAAETMGGNDQCPKTAILAESSGAGDTVAPALPRAA